ncbi:hypothetical protein CMI37_36410 [Candidatus Pacearchaeota archaeon]|nr:hypothetical protein [Candidatus Pacearchaeota archaeon]
MAIYRSYKVKKPKRKRPGGSYLPRRLGETMPQYKKRKASGGEIDLKKDFPKVRTKKPGRMR